MRQFVGSMALAWVTPLANEILALGRNILMARLLGTEEFGQAILIGLALRLAEMGTDVGIEKLMVQARDGGSSVLQRHLHGASVLRGLFTMLVLLALALPFEIAFDGGPVASTYLMLALLPFIRGFQHLDYRRLERHGRFHMMAAVDLGASILTFAMVPVCYWVMGDHRMAVALFAVHQITLVVLSHVLAERRYRVGFSQVALRRVWVFGRPLVLNAVLIWLTFQFDRMIVAKYFSWSDVALYGVAFQLAILPTQVLTRATQSILAPRLRQALARGTMVQAFGPALGRYGVTGLAFVAGYGALAGLVIGTLYGADYVGAGALYWVMGLAAGLRILRAPVSQFNLAVGRTADLAHANLWRALAVPAAVLSAHLGWGLVALAACAVVGEVLAALCGVRLFLRNAPAAMGAPKFNKEQIA